VFEMGVQLVGNLNKEKLLDKVVGKARETEAALVIAEKARKVAEDKVAPLKLSNEQYVQNNQRLDVELVKIRKELETAKQSCESLRKEIETVKTTYQTFTKSCEERIVEIETIHKRELTDMIRAKNKEIINIVDIKKKRRPLKKRGS